MNRILSIVLIFGFFNGIDLANSADEFAPEFDPLQEVSTPWTHAKVSLLLGSAATIGFLIFEDRVSDPAQRETVEDRPLGSFSKWGNLAGQLVPNLLYFAAFQTHGWLSSNSKSKEKALVMIKATAYASVITTAFKYSIREPRPDGSSRNSFPSGHSTTAFAFVGVIDHYESWPWVIAAYGLGDMVAYSRMNDNRHYVYDVLAGATIGLSYGLGISRYTSQKLTAKNGQTKQVTYFPILDHDLGWGLGSRISF